MKFSKKKEVFTESSKDDYNPILCLCWNCGKEIRLHDHKYFINDDIWCAECVEGGGVRIEQ